jgi:hypothetical protein
MADHWAAEMGAPTAEMKVAKMAAVWGEHWGIL